LGWGVLILDGIGLAARSWGCGWAFAKRVQNFHRSPSWADDLISNIGTKVKTTVVFWH
jgi:hypothetical protein